MERWCENQYMAREDQGKGTLRGILNEVKRLQVENRGLKDLAISEWPGGGVTVGWLPERHGGYKQGLHVPSESLIWFPTREAAEAALALAVEKSGSVAAEATRKEGDLDDNS